MPELLIAFSLFIFISVGGLYRVFTELLKRRRQYKALRSLEHIRQHDILIKPDSQPHTYSGKFAGRVMRFTFGKHLTLQVDVEVNLQEDVLWIYPLKHRFKNTRIKTNLEKNRAWTGNVLFDKHYYIAGRPRHFAYGVMHPARRIQQRLLDYPRSVIIVENNRIFYYPNPPDTDQLTGTDWYHLMSLLADFADYVEGFYEDVMYKDLEVDENASPQHSGGHVN